MDRWFFGNTSDESATELSKDPTNVKNSPGNNGRIHTFRVLVNQSLEQAERVAITGECSSLGRWLPAHCVQLNRENGELNK